MLQVQQLREYQRVRVADPCRGSGLGLASDPTDSVIGLGIVALGIPVYYLSGQREAAATRELVS